MRKTAFHILTTIFLVAQLQSINAASAENNKDTFTLTDLISIEQLTEIMGSAPKTRKQDTAFFNRSDLHFASYDNALFNLRFSGARHLSIGVATNVTSIVGIKNLFSDVKERAVGHEVVKDLGEEAIFYGGTEAKVSPGLWVLLKNRYINIMLMSREPQSENKETAIRIAKFVVDALESKY